MDLIRLGKITAPQGIRGEVRVYPYTDEATRFSEINSVLLDGESHRIEGVRYQKNIVILKLSGIDDRNAAEAVRAKELSLKREDLWEQPQDSYFIDDLTGCAVASEDGTHIGTLSRIHSRPHQDLYEIETAEGGSFLLPAVREFVRGVDLEGRVITVRLIEGLMQ